MQDMINHRMEFDTAKDSLPYYKNAWKEKFTEEIINIIHTYNPTNKKTSLLINSEDELKNHKIFLENLIQKHAIVAERKGMANYWNVFPNLCCWYSTNNIINSSVIYWYSQVVWASHERHDHSYVILPFVMNNSNWCIIIDPTYQQLATEELINNRWVLIKKEGRREYRTKRAKWKNLYPQIITRVSNKKKNKDIEWKRKVQKYLHKCFQHPIYTKAPEIST